MWMEAIEKKAGAAGGEEQDLVSDESRSFYKNIHISQHRQTRNSPIVSSPAVMMLSDGLPHFTTYPSQIRRSL
jgi:hypothetical protein